MMNRHLVILVKTIIVCLLAACSPSPGNAQVSSKISKTDSSLKPLKSGSICFQLNENFYSNALDDGSIKFNYNSYKDFLNTNGPTGFGNRIGIINHHADEQQYNHAIEYFAKHGRVTKSNGVIYSIRDDSSISFTDARRISVHLKNPETSTYQNQLKELVVITDSLVKNTSKCRSVSSRPNNSFKPTPLRGAA